MPNRKQVVTLTKYDVWGRVMRNYLPYESQRKSGFIYDAETEQKNYYQSSFNSVYGYSQMEYDRTTKAALIEQSQPGDSYRMGSGHTIKTKVDKNIGSDNVKKYSFYTDGVGVMYTGIYSPYSLTKKETIDPQGDKVYQYYDAEEVLIAEEIRTDTASLFTYYLYDDIGLLRYIIPPTADIGFKINAPRNLRDLQKYCFYTEYDERQRPYKIYVPGAGYTINLYDKRDRLVLSQSENLRAEGKWVFTKYDDLGRPVITGTCGGTEAEHKAGLEAQTIFGETREILHHGYSNRTYPTRVYTIDYLTINYYDDYDWQGDSPEAGAVSARPHPMFTLSINEKAAGLLTGTKNKVLGIPANQWLYTAKYYDDKYNEIHCVNQLYPSGVELVYKKYDFAGKPILMMEKQTINNRDEGYERHLQYDERGRLSEIKQRVLGSPQQELVSVAKYKYNGLSQVIEKTNHNDIDTTRFFYGLDGRLTGTESPLFSYKLYFENKPDNLLLASYPRYDGNVNMIEWHSGSNKNGYRYEYDDLKQLKHADFMSAMDTNWVRRREYFEGYITYDPNGNIKTLKRTGNTTGYIHDIKNTYEGNKLIKSNINGTDYNYTYDGNGNLISDGYKGINIVYNILNLPERIFAGTDEVSYIYSAAGVKLATKVGSSYTYYRGDLVYNNDELDHIIFPEGIIRKASGGYAYYYAKRDHLGSTRVLCYHQAGAMRAVQTTDYYPFGLSFFSNGTNYNRYLFSGKELQDQNVGGNKLMLYDFGARNYDPTLGRWFNPDPANQFNNPYTYCANNPVNYVDPNGMFLPIDPLNEKEWERQKRQIERTRNQMEKRINNMDTDNKNYEAVSERLSSLNSTLKTMSAMDSSKEVYSLTKAAPGENGGLTLNSNRKIVIKYGSTPNFVHEVTHAGQFESYDLGFSYTGRTLAQDVYDEIDAYKAQYAYSPESVAALESSSYVFSSSDITASWLFGIRSNGKLVYNNKTSNIGLSRVTINSTKKDLIKAYPKKDFSKYPDNKPLKYMVQMYYKR